MKHSNPSEHHLPVLYHEIIKALAPRNEGHYVDGTLGAGGHSWGILEASAPNGRLLGLDLDPLAIQIAAERLNSFQGRFTLLQESYVNLRHAMERIGWDKADGIVIDLGVSSMQLDLAQRGFSFREDGPLDMRFNPETGTSAAELLSSLSEEALAEIIWKYGEERHARRIASAIVAHRPIQTTRELADLIENTIGRRGPGGRKPIHPATRTFQAIRIAVNDELGTVEAVLPEAIEALKPGGIFAVISFHSLEDRIVKRYFQQESKDCICPPEQPYCTCGHKASIEMISRKPIQASEAEIADNPRSRSARLRIIRKI
ncbi:MAG: 16S rRNA (cytosine(1402)-N(4))-methyltransferase RsmH [Anaerolineaceae bacterium]|nr:16S rRNA (cytosine(1402)-N(4))-methyltransferase RsmH [Anaerolineaceae bacterium]